MIEDDLRATMRAHDADAPSATDLDTPSVRRSRQPLAVIMTVVAVLGVVAGVWFTREGRQAALSASGCPSHYRGGMGVEWVPQVSSDRSRLAPAATPRRVTVCAYLHGSRPVKSTDSVPLTGARVIAGSRAAIAGALHYQPRFAQEICLEYLAKTDFDNYLIRFDYPNGERVWVAAPGDHCVGASNGAFRSSINLRDLVAPAYRTGRWPATRTVGRIGEDSSMVPGDPVSLTVKDGKRQRTVTSGFRPLVAAMNAAPTVSWSNGCDPHGRTVAFVDLVFHYRTGPDVDVSYGSGCTPEVENQSLAITDGAPFRAMITALLR